MAGLCIDSRSGLGNSCNKYVCAAFMCNFEDFEESKEWIERGSVLLYLWENMRNQICVYSSCRDGLFFKLYFSLQGLEANGCLWVKLPSFCSSLAASHQQETKTGLCKCPWQFYLSLSQPRQHILHNLLSAVSARIKYFYQMRTQRLTHHHAERHISIQNISIHSHWLLSA